MGSTDQASTFFSLKLFPLIAAEPQKPQKLTASKIKDEKFGPKFNSSLKNGYFGALIFQEIDFFEHLTANIFESGPMPTP